MWHGAAIRHLDASRRCAFLLGAVSTCRRGVWVVVWQLPSYVLSGRGTEWAAPLLHWQVVFVGAITGVPFSVTAGGGRSAVLFLVMVPYAYGFLLQAFARVQNRGCALQAVVVDEVLSTW